MSYAFERDPGEWSQEAWRALERAVYRWVRAHGGSALLAATAAWASLADAAGDAALPLVGANRIGMPPLAPADIEQLRAQPMVAGATAVVPQPFLLDASGRFYLWRNHFDECEAARRINARRASPATALAIDSASLEADLDVLFQQAHDAELVPQREAVRRVVGRRLFVLTGSPGTGKTTTVLRMLMMLQRHAPSPPSIQIAAPTGKAAQRLAQALRAGKAALRDQRSPLPARWRSLLDAIADADALTVHRLLGYQPWRDAFRRNARDPIAADIVVVDEASMLDLSMLRTLLAAVKPDATLILVGDADQLTSVATGSVLMDIVAALEAGSGSDIVRLRHSFRAEQHLVALNEAVRCGDGAAVSAAITASREVTLQAAATPRQLGERLHAWAAAIAAARDLRPTLPAPEPLADAVGAAHVQERLFEARAEAVRAALAALARQQLLCALRETEFGALAINVAIERTLRGTWRVAENSDWYPGRAVIITRNDYATGLFNGDVGLCLGDVAGTLQVWFEAARDTGAGAAAGGVRGFSPNTLPAHETAFAITIHKSQGSEYDHVAVLLTPDPAHRVLSRQLLYTAVSRARRRVELWCSREVLQAAVAHRVERQGGLRERLLPAVARTTASAKASAAKTPATGGQLDLPF